MASNPANTTKDENSTFFFRSWTWILKAIECEEPLLETGDVLSHSFTMLLTPPIHWDIKTHRFRFVPTHRELFPWYLVIFINTLVLGFGSASWILISKNVYDPLSFPTVTPLRMIILGALLFLGGGYVLCLIGMFVHGQNIVLAINGIIELKKILKHQSKNTLQSVWMNLFGFGIRLCLRSSVFITLLLVVPIGLLFSFDPYYHIAYTLVPNRFSSVSFRSGLFVVRYLMASMIILEGVRTFAGALLIAIGTLKFANDCIYLETVHFQRISRFKRDGSHINYYRRLLILLDAGHDLKAFWTLATILFSTFFIFCNFVVIRASSVVPVVVHALLALFAVGSFIVFNLCLPWAGSFHENSKEMLKKWRFHYGLSSNGNRRFFVKDVKSLRPAMIILGFGSTNFFYFKKSTKAAFFLNIVDYTVSLLLSVPQDIIKREE